MSLVWGPKGRELVERPTAALAASEREAVGLYARLELKAKFFEPREERG